MLITKSLDLQLIFKGILDELMKQEHVDASAILQFKDNPHQLRYEAWQGFKKADPESLSYKTGQKYAGLAAQNRQPLFVSAGDSHNSGENILMEKEGLQSCSILPLEAKGRVLGVLQIYSKERLAGNYKDLKEFLTMLAEQTSLAIDNIEMFKRNERSKLRILEAYESTIEGWAYALDLKDDETQQHSQRVTEMTLKTARELGVDEEELIHIRHGALLHDIGKMAIPDAILLKKGKLTQEEREVIKQHPVHAYKMIAGIDYLRPAIHIPYCHQERWDGSGYPRGLEKRQIPLPARIFAVVDIWDALTSNRPYRRAWQEKDVLNYLHEQEGVKLDPEIVPVFIKVLEKSRGEKKRT